MTSEANLFTVNPDGIKVHWKLVSGTPAEELTKLITNVGVLTKVLAERGYTPDDMGRFHGNGGGGGAPATAGPVSGKASKYKGPVYSACPKCSGDVYDNRQKKDSTPSWRGPWFKCKDEDCGWATFKTDGAEGR